MFIKRNYQNIKQSLPDHITLVAVSKTKPISDILEAYNQGQRVFGENKIQEMVDKYEELPKDIRWHMIGHLQRNKVKYMAHFVDLIHGVDSFKTLVEINKQAEKHGRIIHCLLQAKIAQEDTKFGLSFQDIEEIMTSEKFGSLSHVKVTGLMGMASYTTDQAQIITEFKSIHRFFQHLKQLEFKSDNININTLSIGMSGDYQLAIDQGSTMVRIGSAIFGDRHYIA